ncbi:hypothetical protein U8335_26785 [Roseiconus lacunae]|uniref:hypothetical protein n=1 Tax=Roseiconus lacunae TaxID=2605694 RepID=UPI00308B96B9|nr:hypothetical protein U8335_26785 [Stieleria sp. HD01]
MKLASKHYAALKRIEDCIDEANLLRIKIRANLLDASTHTGDDGEECGTEGLIKWHRSWEAVGAAIENLRESFSAAEPYIEIVEAFVVDWRRTHLNSLDAYMHCAMEMERIINSVRQDLESLIDRLQMISDRQLDESWIEKATRLYASDPDKYANQSLLANDIGVHRSTLSRSKEWKSMKEHLDEESSQSRFHRHQGLSFEDAAQMGRRAAE